MPTYLYRCDTCQTHRDVIKAMSEAESKEYCVTCNTESQRIFTIPSVSTAICQFQAHFNHGLGKVCESKRQMDDHVRRIRGETGKDIVEVGTDNLQSVKKQLKSYDEHINLGDFT